MSREDQDKELTPAILEAIVPHRSCGDSGYWALSVAIPAFGWEVLSVVGTISYLAKLFTSGLA